MSINTTVSMDIYIDIDETICRTPNPPGTPRDYSQATPIPENIALVNELYDMGHNIVIWTARGGRTGKDWTEVTAKQMEEWGVKHHELRLDKPPFNILIDDKVLNTLRWEDGGNEAVFEVITRQFQDDKHATTN